jgi:hypothetical protein
MVVMVVEPMDEELGTFKPIDEIVDFVNIS